MYWQEAKQAVPECFRLGRLFYSYLYAGHTFKMRIEWLEIKNPTERVKKPKGESET